MWRLFTAVFYCLTASMMFGFPVAKDQDSLATAVVKYLNAKSR